MALPTNKQRLDAHLKIHTLVFGTLYHGPVDEVLSSPSSSSTVNFASIDTPSPTTRKKMVVDLGTGTGKWCVVSSFFQVSSPPLFSSFEPSCTVRVFVSCSSSRGNTELTSRCGVLCRVMAMAEKFPHVKFRGIDLGAFGFPPSLRRVVSSSPRLSGIMHFLFYFRPSFSPRHLSILLPLTRQRGAMLVHRDSRRLLRSFIFLLPSPLALGWASCQYHHCMCSFGVDG